MNLTATFKRTDIGEIRILHPNSFASLKELLTTIKEFQLPVQLVGLSGKNF